MRQRLLALTAALAVAAGAMGARGWTAPREASDPPPILLRSGPVHLGGPGVAATGGALGPGERGLFLVQFRGPVQEWQKQSLRDLGAEVGDYLPDYAFLVRMDAGQAARVARLGFVRGVGRYTANLKLDSALAQARGEVTVRLVSFGGGSLRGAVDRVAAAGGGLRGLGARAVVAAVGAERLHDLARSEDVVWVEPVRANRLFNDKAAGVMKVDSAAWARGLTGAGQLVGVADTGLDTGADDSSLHPDFQGRIQALFALGRRGDASDPHGHGTHVAGSIVGTGAAGYARGMAAGARLVFQSVGDANGGLGGIPDDLGTLFDQAYQAGARIHSDSWGVPYDSGGSVYDAQSASVDRFVWENPDMAIFFAAGNDGDYNQDGKVDYGTVSTPGTAKNAITVGASENNRPELGKLADNPDQVASFSSRGPTRDNRVKPDVVAPGSWILSTKSSKAPESNFWKGFNDRYAYMGGTSMATPLSAGAAALVRQYFVEKLQVTPRAALLKAALIHGAVAVEGTWKDYGWGRLDLGNVLKPFAFENEAVALKTNDTRTYTYAVKPGQPFKVTLVWTDYPANPSAGKALVNDLDLEVRTPDGRVLLGNAEALGLGGADRSNNVEQVTVAAPAAGTYTVAVRGQNVPQGPQRYALVVSGNLGEGEPNPPQDPPANPPADKVPPRVEWTGPAAGATLSGSVTLSARASDAGSGVRQVQFYANDRLLGQATAAPYTLNWDTRTVANGTYRLFARATDRAGNEAETAPVTVTVGNRPAPPPEADSLTQTFAGQADGYGTIQRFFFDVRGPGKVAAELLTTGSADVDVVIYDSWGRKILTTREGNGPANVPEAVAGTYQGVVYVNGGVGTWQVKVTHPARTVAQSRFSGRVEAGTGRTARFPVQMKRAGALNLQLDWTGSADLDIYLLDPLGRLIARATGDRTNPETISALVGAGTYQVYVVAESGRADFTVTATAPR